MNLSMHALDLSEHSDHLSIQWLVGTPMSMDRPETEKNGYLEHSKKNPSMLSSRPAGCKDIAFKLPKLQVCYILSCL